MAPRVVFIGMPGVGKSTLARALVTRLNVPAVDSDALIVEETGQMISQIFATRGEAGFRELEAQVIARALDTFDGILSLGGGAITTASTRELLKEHNVVLIDGPDSLLVHRITHSHTVRPLLADDPVARIAQLRKERSELYYSVARHVLISGQGTLEKMVDTMEKILREGREVITVGGQSPYDVVIGHNLVMEAVRCVRDYAKVFVVYSPDIAWYVHNYIEMALTGARIEYSMMELPRGESAKTYQTIEAAWDYAGKERIGRDAVVLAVGGGATTDMGGFLAATWLRGIPVVQMPTTVLAMVDAAVGGKTGINTPQGKNLVGAFYPPRRVLCDLDVLSSL
ncbi:MAG: AAA family ATPase, partial [Arcanobacterium sp.]|nr:AAA family ATPase [Arcanobacterium sp.]